MRNEELWYRLAAIYFIAKMSNQRANTVRPYIQTAYLR